MRKPWSHTKEARAAIEADIAARWRDEHDKHIAERHGVSPQYVTTVRKRMGLTKTLLVMAELRPLHRKEPERLTRHMKRYRMMSREERTAYREWHKQEAAKRGEAYRGLQQGSV